MRRSRGRHDTSQRNQNNPSQSDKSRGGGFEQTGTGYRYEDEQRRFGNPSQRGFSGNPTGQESWREPSERSRYSESRDYRSDYDQGSRFGSPERSRSYGWGDVGRADWEREGYEPRYGRGSDEYGYDPEDRLGATEGGYDPGDYSSSGGSGSDWSSRRRGSYGQGSQQGFYGQSSSNEPWSEGSYEGPNRGVARGSFGQGSQPSRSQQGTRGNRFQQYQGRSQGSFAGRGPQGYKRSDERIQEDVNEALTQDPEIDPTNIQVEVQNGEVTLKGSVSDREAKRIAEDIAESCSGVKEVQNQLRIKREEGSESETSRREKTDEKQRSHRQIAS